MRPHEILAELGNCRQEEPNTMYPEPNDERALAIAVSVCQGCVVMDFCRETAMTDHEMHGVWGGMTEDERRKLGNKMRRAKHQRCEGTEPEW